jgi:hypothetical protein
MWVRDFLLDQVLIFLTVLGDISSRPGVFGVFSRVSGKPGISGFFSPDTLGFAAGAEIVVSSISQSSSYSS